MFIVRFATQRFRPDLTLTMRNSVDGWDHDIAGVYRDDQWQFELDEGRYPQGAEFKFLSEGAWMEGPNLFFPERVAGSDFFVQDEQVNFPPHSEVIVENGNFQQRFFAPQLDEEHEYDVIVVGSGMGGGTVADQLADQGADVLVLEAGSALFTTHTANLPRKYQLGQFEKHLWALFDEYKVKNFRDAPQNEYVGAQAFNLGGRSVFWGAFIPRMTWWELAAWPEQVRWDLEGTAYTQAEDLMYWPPPPSNYQQQIKSWLGAEFPEYDHFDAPMAVRQRNAQRGTLAPGVFSTADLLTEGRVSTDPDALGQCTVNLNHAVTRLIADAEGKITQVETYDLLASTTRTYKAKVVVLAAGAIESPKIYKMSGLKDPHGLVGKGITDHPVLFTHFSIPVGKARHRVDDSSKILSRHKGANSQAHPYNILLELGADLNQGRYLDPDTLAQHRKHKGDAMLGEIVFLFNSGLVEDNYMEHTGPSYAKPVVFMKKSPAADAFLGEVGAFKDRILAKLEAEALPGQDLSLKWGGVGGVAHEVGSLRMKGSSPGIVDENLRVEGHDNLFVADLSVFPSSPAANPSLTLVALALRLAGYIKHQVLA